jgi:hypothetical protein
MKPEAARAAAFRSGFAVECIMCITLDAKTKNRPHIMQICIIWGRFLRKPSECDAKMHHMLSRTDLSAATDAGGGRRGGSPDRYPDRFPYPAIRNHTLTIR